MEPWTFSRLEGFETCPKKFYHLKVAKDVVEPPTEHTEWGKEVHTAFENLVLKGEELPSGMKHWNPLAEKVLTLPGEKMPEFKMSLSKSFQPCEWGESWTRGIADLLIVGKNTAAILDYKTGKFKPSQQLKLYAAYTFAYYPQVQTVNTGFVWLKEKRITRDSVHREDVPQVWAEFLTRVNRLERAYEEDHWPARPSGLCNGWCSVRQCEHYRSRK